MKNQNRTSVVIFIFTVFISCLVPSQTAAAQTSGEEKRYLVDASSDNFPPMNLLDSKGKLTGFGRELADAVIEAAGAEVIHIHSPHWVQVLDWLDTGRADFIHDTGYTEEREKYLDYSDPIIEMPEVIFARADEYAITDFNSLKGKTVACVDQHITHLYLQQFPAISCFVVKTPVEALYELISGNVDAFVYPKQIALYLIQNLRLTRKVKITGSPLRNLSWSMVVKKGNKEVLRLLNLGLAKVRASGTYARLYDKWWGTKILTGYSEQELFAITAIITGGSLAFAVALGLLFFNISLRKQKQILETQIIQRRRAEQALQESEQQYRALFEQAAASIVLVNSKGELVAFNDRAHENLGYSREEFKKLNIADLKLFKSDQEVAAHTKKIIKEGSDLFETEMTTKEGRAKFFSVIARTIFLHGEQFVSSIWNDITVGKQAEEALRKSEMQYRSLFEDSIDSIFVSSKAGKLVDANRAMLDLSGYSKKEMIGMEMQKLFMSPADKTRFLTAVKKKGSIRNQEVILWKKDKTQIDCLLTASPRLDDTGRILGYQCLIRDVSAQKRLEAQLRQSLKMEAIGTLAGGIAHDFNNILAAILGYAELVKLEIQEGSAARQRIDELFKAALRAKELVKQILTFTRKSEQKRKPVQIKIIIEDALKLLRAAIPRTIEIRQEINPQSGNILADPTQIHQVVLNLCTNAAQAMDEQGGVLEVSLDNEQLSADDLRKEAELKPGSYVRLSVRDPGHGIDPDIISRIFDPYFTTKNIGKGSGMGLAVVRGIVKSHEGMITVKSSLGKGTRVDVFFPIIDREVVREIEQNEPPATGNERILVVDDEESIALITKTMLERQGYQVRAESNGMAALELFRLHPGDFDLVLTDQTMPRISGVELAKELMSIRADIPVILCTGYSSKVNREQALALGIKAFAVKPVENRELGILVRGVLDGQ